MIRRNRGSNTKVEAKKDVVKGRAISVKNTLIVAAITLVATFFVYTSNAAGIDGIDPDTQAKIDLQYALSNKYKSKAHLLAHKNGKGHKYHRQLSSKKSLTYEITRKNKWKKIYNQELMQNKKLKKFNRKQINRCVKAGFPRKLCPDIILGAKQEHKKAWAFDSNLAWIIKHESGFRPCVINGGAIDCNYQGTRSYGLFQFIGSTWTSYGCRITSNPRIQTRCGIRYIKRRYNSPAGAVAFWRSHNYY